MVVDASIARGVRSAAAADYDAACKRLLSEKQILARMLHDWLGEFSDASPETIARECFAGEPRIGKDPVDRDLAGGPVNQLPTEDKTLNEGAITFDIRFEARTPSKRGEVSDGLVCIEVDVEAQNNFNPGYPLLKRAVFYAGRLLSLQGAGIVTQSHYERVRKVTSIWICAHPPKRYAGTVTTFSIKPTMLVGNATYQQGDYDLIELVMACLNDKKPGSSDGALGMVEVLLSRKLSAQQKLDLLHNKYGIIVTEELDKKVMGMCNLSIGILEEGFEQGWKGGRAEGIETGRAEGIEVGRAKERQAFLQVAVSTVKDGTFTLRDAAARFCFTEQELADAL